MRDVRSRLGVAYKAQITTVVVILTLAIALHRSPRWRSVVPWGLLLGSGSRSASQRLPCR